MEGKGYGGGKECGGGADQGPHSKEGSVAEAGARGGWLIISYQYPRKSLSVHP